MKKNLLTLLLCTSILSPSITNATFAQDTKTVPAQIQKSLTKQKELNKETTEEEEKEEEHPAKPGTMTRWLIKEGNSYVTEYDEDNPDYENTEPVIPDEYEKAMYTEGKDLGKEPNTFEIADIVMHYVPLEDNTGAEADFDKVNEVLEWDGVPQVGMNGIRSFFGHYHDIIYQGAFAPLVAQNYFDPGNEFIVTDEEGISKCYRITSIIPLLGDSQHNYFYNEDSVPFLAYYGNGDDMVAFLTCRWDKAAEQMDFAVGYRIW